MSSAFSRFASLIRRTRSNSGQILIVDDDLSLRIEEMFEAAGAQVERVYDCESALKSIHRGLLTGKVPSAVVVDMALPLAPDGEPRPLSGLGLMREIQSLSPTTKLVPLTGHGWGPRRSIGYDVLERAGDIGMEGWITKPPSPHQVTRLVTTLQGRPGHRKLLRIRQPVSRTTTLLLGAGAFLLPLVLWLLLTSLHFVKPLFLPSPAAVLEALATLFVHGSFLNDIAASLFRVLTAFGIATAIAVPLGLSMGTFSAVEAFLSPLSAFIRYMPAAAFIPLIILWLGIGHVQKIAVIFLGVFFYLLVLIAANVAEVPLELIETAYTLGASRLQVLLKVIAPAALPSILDSLRAMIGAAWTYLIVAELVAAQVGIGYRILEAQRFLQTGRVIAGIIVIGVIGVITDFLFRGLSHLLTPWKR